MIEGRMDHPAHPLLLFYCLYLSCTSVKASSTGNSFPLHSCQGIASRLLGWGDPLNCVLGQRAAPYSKLCQGFQNLQTAALSWLTW